eukprot:11919025-Alexandrium_andersonii.AAC.1
MWLLRPVNRSARHLTVSGPAWRPPMPGRPSARHPWEPLRPPQTPPPRGRPALGPTAPDTGAAHLRWQAVGLPLASCAPSCKRSHVERTSYQKVG